ncbi:hypothetical protein EDB85DRAFT_1892758 [Lactarius pseudohatsudake]|nr:hypothetical protein EDB85DRAFT_1892758 [Lactarius pseudohatsudake]
MARTKQSTRRPLSERIVKIRNEICSQMCYMSTGAHLTGAHLKKPQKKKAPRRKRKIRDIDLTEEVRDLEREIALSSTSEASKSPPCTKDGRTLHGTQERNEPKRGPTMLCARKRRSVSTATEKCDRGMVVRTGSTEDAPYGSRPLPSSSIFCHSPVASSRHSTTLPLVSSEGKIYIIY